MKKILVIIPAFNHGGTNRSLLNFLNTIDRTRYSIQILTMYFSGPYKEKFAHFDLLPEDFSLSPVFSFGNPFRDLGVLKGIRRLIWKIIFKTVFRKKEKKLFRFASRKYSKQGYDVVIGFQEGKASCFASEIKTEKRIAWVHCDYSNYLKITNAIDEREIYERFQHIVCVSEYTASVFRGIYPILTHRTVALHNLIDADGIIKASNDRVDFAHDCFTLISVGRMDPVKRFACIPKTAQLMKNNGCIFKWYIIGSGGEEYENIRKNIVSYGIDNEVILLGAKNNPYPYISASNLLVCPSYSEACPNVVNEAKVLHIPVVAANFPTAKEYIDNEINGFIVPIDEMADILIRLCKDRQLYARVKAKIEGFIYDNDKIIRQIEALLDGEIVCEN